MVQFRKPPRVQVESVMEDIDFDGKTLGELRDLLNQKIDQYGPNAIVREVCKPHDNYQFSVHKVSLETEFDYRARCTKARADFDKAQKRDLEELKRLQKKLGVKK